MSSIATWWTCVLGSSAGRPSCPIQGDTNGKREAAKMHRSTAHDAASAFPELDDSALPGAAPQRQADTSVLRSQEPILDRGQEVAVAA